MPIKLKLINKKTGQVFYKEFSTEYERDKFRRKLRYSKNLIVVDGYDPELDKDD